MLVFFFERAFLNFLENLVDYSFLVDFFPTSILK